MKEVKRALSKASASTSSQLPHREASIAPNTQMGAMEPLLRDANGQRRDRDRRPTELSSQPSLESALEFECEEEGVTVGGSR